MPDDDRLPWFPCYPSKLLGALAGMPPAQGYTYWIVCLRIYEIGGPCPDNLDALARRTGFNRRVVSDALDALFRAGKLVREPAGIMNPFAADVMVDARSKMEKRKTAGQAGGKKSAQKRKEKQSTDPSKGSASVEHTSTHLHLQDSLFSNENRASGGELVAMKDPPLDASADYYRRFKEVWPGPSSGAMATKLLRARGGNVALARAGLETATTRGDIREYIGALIRNGGNDGKAQDARGGGSILSAKLRAAVAADDRNAQPDAAGGEPDRRH